MHIIPVLSLFMQIDIKGVWLPVCPLEVLEWPIWVRKIVRYREVARSSEVNNVLNYRTKFQSVP